MAGFETGRQGVVTQYGTAPMFCSAHIGPPISSCSSGNKAWHLRFAAGGRVPLCAREAWREGDSGRSGEGTVQIRPVSRVSRLVQAMEV